MSKWIYFNESHNLMRKNVQYSFNNKYGLKLAHTPYFEEKNINKKKLSEIIFYFVK